MPAPVTPGPPLEAPEEAKGRKSSVSLIGTPGGGGSRFVLAARIIATNAHGVNDFFLDEVRLSFGVQRSQTFRATRLLYEDGERDICVLESEEVRDVVEVWSREFGNKLRALQGTPHIPETVMKNWRICSGW